MSAEALAELDAQLGGGPAWPGSYFPEIRERRARAFAHFGMLMTEGVRISVSGPGVPKEIQIFWHVMSGRFGEEVMASRAVPPPPGLLRRSCGEAWRAIQGACSWG